MDKKNNNKNKKKNTPVGKLNGGVDHCSLGYASALANPFDSPASCVPTVPSLPSQLNKFVQRGTMSTGTSDFGFVACRPTICSDGNTHPVIHTASTFTGTNTNVNATGIVGTNFQTPYPSILFSGSSAATDRCKWRPVAYGLRVRYIDKAINRGGRIVTLRDQTNGSTMDMSFDDLASRQSAKMHNVTSNQWTTICYAPADPEEFEFGHVISPEGLGYFNLCIAVEGPRETQIAFEYEATIHCEIVGKLAYNVRLHFGSPNLSSKSGDILVAIQRGMFDTYAAFKSAYKDLPPDIIKIAQTVFRSYAQSSSINPLARIEL
jgi:hypothetical protein